ncbi:MAG: TolC family protein [Oceanococcus sp.]
MSRTIAILCLLALTACASLPDRQASLPPMPEAFLASGTQTMSSDWWSSWPELEDLMRLAYADNPGLAATAARLRSAQASLGVQRSGLFPSLNLGAKRSEGVLDDTAGTVHTLSLAADYELDLWGRVGSAARAADYELQASVQDLHAATITLSANVASLWFQVGSARERLALIASDRQSYEKTLSLIETRYRHGQISASDVLRQRQLLESTRADEAVARNNLELLRNALGEILGGVWANESEQPWRGADSDWQLPAVPATGVPSQTVLQRPDVQQAWLRVQSADQAVAAAIAERFPRMDLSINLASSDAGLLDLLDEWTGSILASLFGPVFDGGSRRANVGGKRAVLDQRLAEFREQVLSAFREIQDALVTEHNLIEQLASLNEQQRLSDATVQSLLVQLRHGTADFPSLLESQISFSGVRRQWLSTRQQLIDNRISLYRALAGPLAGSLPAPLPELATSS